METSFRHIFFFIFPYAIFAYPVLYIYIFLIKTNEERVSLLGHDKKKKVCSSNQTGLNCNKWGIYFLQSPYQSHSRTNLMTARESFGMILILMTVGSSTAIVNFIFPFLRQSQPVVV